MRFIISFCYLSLYIYIYKILNYVVSFNLTTKPFNNYNFNYTPNQSFKLVSIDIKNTKSTEQVTYDFNSFNQTHNFTPNEGLLIDKVTKSNLVLWDAKDYGFQYGSSVLVGKNNYGERIFRIYFPSTFPFPEHKLIGRPEKIGKEEIVGEVGGIEDVEKKLTVTPKKIIPEIDEPDLPERTTFKKIIEIFLDSKTNTEEYFYYYDQLTDTGIYIPKKGIFFYKIKFCEPWYTYPRTCINLWDADKDGRISNMVMVNGISQKVPNVNVYYTDGSREFHYLEYYYQWLFKPKPQQSISNLNKSEHPSNVNIYTQDKSSTKLNDVTKYSVSMYKVYNSFKIKYPNQVSYDYLFKENARCVKIVINDNLVWEQKNNLFPDALYYFEYLNLVVIQFNNFTYNVYKFHSQQWILYSVN